MHPFNKTVPKWRLPPSSDRVSRKAWYGRLDEDSSQEDRPDLKGNDGYLFVRFRRGREHCVSEGGWPRWDGPNGEWVEWTCKCKGCMPWVKDAKWAKLFHYAWGAKITNEVTSIHSDIMKDVDEDEIIRIIGELGEEGDTWEAITWEEGNIEDMEMEDHTP